MKFWKLHENHICERRIENWMKDDHRSYIRIIILSRAYNEPIQRPAPSWLVSLILLVEHCTGIAQRSRVQIPYKPELFSGFLLATAKVAYITAMIILHSVINIKVNYNYHKKSPRILRGNFLRSFITLTIFYVEDCQTWTCCSFLFRKSNSYLFL